MLIASGPNTLSGRVQEDGERKRNLPTPSTRRPADIQLHINEKKKRLHAHLLEKIPQGDQTPKPRTERMPSKTNKAKKPSLNVNKTKKSVAQPASENHSHVDSMNIDNEKKPFKQAASETNSHTDAMNVDDAGQPAVQVASETSADLHGSEMDIKNDEGPAAQTASETGAEADSNDMDARGSRAVINVNEGMDQDMALWCFGF